MGLLYSLDQSINIPGIISTFRALNNPRLLIPDIRAKNLNQVYPDYLRNNRIRNVLFDMDNTLSLPYEYSLYPDIADRFNEFRARFRVAIISNSAGVPSDKGEERAKRIEDAFNVHVIRHDKKKPDCIEEVLRYFVLTWDERDAVAMIGDRVTDVVFGNSYDMFTALVEPFDLAKDNAMARMIRPYERMLMERAIAKYGRKEARQLP